jgi:small-conductance mechanosensitive channel
MKWDFDATVHDLFSPATLHGALLYGIVIATIAWLIGRAMDLAFRRMLDHPRYVPSDRTAIRFLAQLLRLVVYLLAFVTYANLVPALRNLGSAWLASVGVVSVVLGLAAQNTLGNLIAGISLLLYRPFNLGDRLQVLAPSGLESGTVESLNLGYTVLRTSDNRRVVIPNSLMASQTNVNLSLTDVRKLCVVPIQISRNADIDQARKIVVDLARAHPKVLEYASCPVTALGATTLTLTLKVWCVNTETAEDIKNDLLEAVKKRFEEANVEIFWRRKDQA